MSLYELVNPAAWRRQWAARPASGRYATVAGYRVRLSTTLLLYVPAFLVTVLVLAVPAYLIVRSVSAGPATINTLTSPRTWQTLGNTALLTGSVVITTALLAVPLAWLTTTTDLPLRRAWAVLLALPLVVPSYVVAYLFVSLLSPRGVLQSVLQPLLGIERLPPIYGFPGAWLVLTLITYPFTYLSVRAAFQRMDPSLIEAARSLGLSSRRAFLRVSVPALRPALAAGSVLVALYCLRDFGAVSLLQFGTFTRVIYNRYQSFRLDEAAAMSLLLVTATLVLLYLDQRSRSRGRYARLSAGCARALPVTRLGMWKVPALAFVALVVFFALVIPTAGLVYWLGRGFSQDLAGAGAGLQSNVRPLATLIRPAWNSLVVSGGAAVLTLALALPVAFLSVRRPGRWPRLFERAGFVGGALPGIVVALAFVFLGINYLRPLYQTLPMMLAAYAVLFLPQAIGAERASLLQVSSSLEEAGRSLGKKPAHVFRRVTLPLVRPGLLAAGTMVFLMAMKELPTTLLLSPIGFNTLVVQVWTNINEAFFARAAMPTLLLILLSSVPLALLTLRDGARDS